MTVPDDETARDWEICSDLLAALEYSRSIQLGNLGLDRVAARLFPKLESAQRNALARDVGPDAAFLARLEWNPDDIMGTVSCRLRVDLPPKELCEKFFLSFELSL